MEGGLNMGRLSTRALLNILSRTNVTVNHSPSRVDPSALPSLPKGQDLKPAPIDPSIDKWFFISGAAV
jgi:inorganic pyrophosphatase